MASSIGGNFGIPMTPQQGKGREVAKTFQEAVFETATISDGAQVAETGLKAVRNKFGASEREKLVAQVALEQAEQIEKNLTVGVMKDDGKHSHKIALTEALSYIASGGVASGAVGAILADIGTRQMDWIRAQKFNTASNSDVRDSNVAGFSMLQQIADRSQDPALELIAHNAMKQVGSRYNKQEKSGKLEGDSQKLLDDSKVLHEAFDNIKVVASLGDAQNPKSIAFLAGETPGDSHGSIGRPGGGWADHPSSGDGFTVSHKASERVWDR